MREAKSEHQPATTKRLRGERLLSEHHRMSRLDGYYCGAYFCIVVFMFSIGLAVDGDLYTVGRAAGSLLRLLASLGSMGAGLLYWIFDFKGIQG